MKQNIITKTLLFITLFFGLTISHAASIPPLINYQGTLTDAAGQPIANGTKKLTFNIYDAASGGNLIWGPQVFDPVPVINGMFNIILGTTVSGGRSIVDAFGAEARFLGITVDTVGQTAGTEITPRQQILSAPYAVQAEKAEYALHGDPVGSIQAFYSQIAPDGWLMCDGRPLTDASLVDGKFDTLKALLQAEGVTTLPDFRGVFPRGRDSFDTAMGARGLDPSGVRGLGNYQVDDFKSHNHTGINREATTWWDDDAAAGTHNKAGLTDSTQHTTNNSGGIETRPKNIAVNYIIKY
ncbi:MAG: phage tail protein [Pseudomonadota bacterium]